MQDMVIKGTGNSRYLKSVEDFMTRYPNYDAFAQALVAGNLPIDLNGTNAAGITTAGTPLNKNNLLKDATAALFGLSANAVPDDVFAKVKALVDANTTLANTRAKIASGSYTGTGTYGKDNPTSLTFDFVPKFVFMTGYQKSSSVMPFFYDANSKSIYGIDVAMLTTSYKAGLGFRYGSSSGSMYSKKSDDGKTIYWYETTGAAYQTNTSGYTYYWVAIG